jgi:hypothetical protein
VLGSSHALCYAHSLACGVIAVVVPFAFMPADVHNATTNDTPAVCNSACRCSKQIAGLGLLI